MYTQESISFCKIENILFIKIKSLDKIIISFLFWGKLNEITNVFNVFKVFVCSLFCCLGFHSLKDICTGREC